MGEMSAKNRRDYGTGSVYRRKSDGLWIGAVSAGFHSNGKPRRITVSAKTEAQAKVRLREKIKQLEDGDTGGALNARTTVKQWADEWLPIVERTLQPWAYSATRSSVTQWIVPTIGHRRLDQLSPADVRKVDEAQRMERLALTTRKRRHSDLMSLLKAARAEGYAVPLRAVEVKAPGGKGKPPSPRTDIPLPDAVRLLEQAAQRPDGSRWVAALLQGMRQGERNGLTRDAIDLERRTLTISWQMQPLPYNVKRDRTSGFRVPDGHEAVQVRGRYHLVRPKSEAGWRVIPLVPWMHSALSTWIDVMPDNPHGLLWYPPVGDPAKLDDEAWYALQDAAGVTHPTGRYYTNHEARHTTATLLLEAGVDPTVIIAILGHSTILTSRGYMHVNTAPLADALGKVAERLALTPPERVADS